jgi:hypothetical protein
MSSNEEITISYHIQEIEKESELNIEEFMNEIEKSNLNDNLIIPNIINYYENYTLKELLLICEYYGFAKHIKSNKLNKQEIIDFLLSFETDETNSDIVFKRQNMWFYINELKSDKFMKKFILW